MLHKTDDEDSLDNTRTPSIPLNHRAHSFPRKQRAIHNIYLIRACMTIYAIPDGICRIPVFQHKVDDMQYGYQSSGMKPNTVV